jgi:hypothetical protein
VIHRYILFLWIFAGFLAAAPLVRAQSETPDLDGAPLEAGAVVAVRGGDFVKARGRAVDEALKKALEEALREKMGEEEYAANAKSLSPLLANPERYVRSYRFLDASDHLDKMTSEVLLSVSLYNEAVERALGDLGVLSGPGAGNRVVVLIREAGSADEAPPQFWEQNPISEAALAGLLGQSGMQVVPRERIRALFPEDQVQKALEGDMALAVRIGWKAGADTVILGNAVSTRLGEGPEAGPASVRSILSVKAISVRRSTVIAAKSDFAQAQGDDLPMAEKMALESASGKISGFLISSFNRFQEQKPGTSARPRPTESLPMTANDL